MSAGLSTPIRLCRAFGMFRPETGSQSVAHGTYQAAIFAVVSAASVSMTVQLFRTSDMKMMARTIDLWTVCLTGLYKWSYVVASDREFREFRRLLDGVHAQAAVAYGPTAAARRFAAGHPRRLRAISVGYVYMGLVVSVCLVLSTINTTHSRSNRSDLEYFNDPKSYPLCCWIPFVVSDRWTFYVLFALKSLVILYTISIYSSIDTYMFSAIYLIGGQLETLNKSLYGIERTVVNDDALQSNPSNNLLPFNGQGQVKCFSKLTECVKLHNSITKCITSLQAMFSTLILFDYLHGIISGTFAIFQTTNSTDFQETVSVFMFIMISFYHQFLNSFFGQFIIERQLSVKEAAYDFPWLRVDKKSRQLLTTMMCRANTPIIISGFYMYKLCYKSFIAFIKALYTYYMVLRKVSLEDKDK